MNVFKRFFNWVQSAPADFCYVTGEWDFKEKGSAGPALSGFAVQSANNHRFLVVLRIPVVAAAARNTVLEVGPRAEGKLDIQNSSTAGNVGIRSN